ncbi:LOW QUALITY PROTEIN: hypothetical protein CVT25_008163 [Psilocybe cyanescens]|uniref:Uncharacterized protein n=1 Tax=Psilocybe cyanescens TaxID=93625 RepID=A0A409XGE6_PSICY|nr:LOW QUALITY PROTEIN: hypothetical protein CVT25_008163 [Psilocybe cyanescens]
MPAFRSKYICGGDAEEAEAKKATKPRAPKKILTEDEKKKRNYRRRFMLRGSKKAWEETLVPWVVNDNFPIPTGTVALYNQVSVRSERDLDHPIPIHSRLPKTFFVHEDVLALYNRKMEAGVSRHPREEAKTSGNRPPTGTC